MRIHRPARALRLTLMWTVIGSSALGVCSCGGSSSKAKTSSSVPQSSTKPASKADTGSSGSGDTNASAICSKLPVADAQALITPTLSAAVPDPRLGGCTFVLPGNALNASNLSVVYETGSGAAGRYKDDMNGTFTTGGQSVKVGEGVTTPLSGVGDKAVWGANAGYPTVSAVKGSVYCSVSTADDATKLTIIGGANDPIPQASQAQQAQYAQLEGKLCNDLFGLVH